MVKFGFAMNYWISKFGFDFHTALDEISLTGWEGIEMAHNSLNYYFNNIDELKLLLDLHNLKVTSFYSHLNLLDRDYFKIELEIIKKKMNLIKKLDSDILLLDGGKKNPNGNSEDDYEVAIGNIKIICDLANSNNLRPTWHQHWGTMFDSKKSFEYLMDSTKDLGLYFCPDTAQLLMSDMDPLRIMEKYKNRISYIHLKDIKENSFVNRYLKPSKKNNSNNNFLLQKYKFLEDSFLDNGCYHINSKYKITEVARGVVDFKPIVKLIKSINFNGWIVVDQDYTEYKTVESLDVNLKNLRYLFDYE